MAKISTQKSQKEKANIHPVGHRRNADDKAQYVESKGSDQKKPLSLLGGQRESDLQKSQENAHLCKNPIGHRRKGRCQSNCFKLAEILQFKRRPKRKAIWGNHNYTE